MASKRSLSIRATLLARTFNPSFTHIPQYNNDCEKPGALTSSRSKIEAFLAQMSSLRLNPSSTCISPSNERKKPEDLNSSGSKIEPFFAQMKSLRFKPSSTHPCRAEHVHSSGSKTVTFLAQRKTLGSDLNQMTFCRTPYGLFGNGLSLKREMSTSTGGANEVANVFEVSMAAADSAFPIAAVQHFIDGVHCVTGLNWWASIAIATLLVRVATFLPILSLYTKRGLMIANINSQWIKIRDRVIATGMEPQAVAEATKKLKEFHNKIGFDTPKYMDLFVQFCIFLAFSLAINNMVRKVPSLKTGGTLWFIDLTTPDPVYILPILLALILLAPLEYISMSQKGVSAIGSMQNHQRDFIIISTPVTMSFHTAHICFGIALSLTNLCITYALRDPRVKKALGIPVIPSARTSTPQRKAHKPMETK